MKRKQVVLNGTRRSITLDGYILGILPADLGFKQAVMEALVTQFDWYATNSEEAIEKRCFTFMDERNLPCFSSLVRYALINKWGS